MLQELHLVAAQYQIDICVALEMAERLLEQTVSSDRFYALGQEAVGQLGRVEGAAEPVQVLAQRLEALQRLAARDDLHRAALDELHHAAVEGLEVSGHAAGGLAHALGLGVQLSVGEGVQREDAVGLAHLALAQDDRLRLVYSGSAHASPAPPGGPPGRGTA